VDFALEMLATEDLRCGQSCTQTRARQLVGLHNFPGIFNFTSPASLL
jgi:hypothetical protein